MDLDTCSICGKTGPAEEYDVCRKCRVSMCETCGYLEFGKLLCPKCKETEDIAEMEAEINADFDTLGEGSEEDGDGSGE